MLYTFWHAGLLIGKSDLSQSPEHALDRAGIFQPTAYGEKLLPRLTGILTQRHELEKVLATTGRRGNSLTPDEMTEVFATSAFGRSMIEITRVLVQVEVRAPDDKRIHLASLAFSTVDELRRLSIALGHGLDRSVADLPAEIPGYVVTMTLLTDAQRIEREAMIAEAGVTEPPFSARPPLPVHGPRRPN